MAHAFEPEPVLAPDAEAPAIRELDALLSRNQAAPAQLVGPDGKQMPVPPSVYILLARIVRELARGHAVTVVPVHAELTTQEAADLLNVSRPFLIKLLESGAIPFHCVGSHRRIRFRDLMAFCQRRSQGRRIALAEMTREAQELGTYE